MKNTRISKVLAVAMVLAMVLSISGTALAGWSDLISPDRKFAAQFDDPDELMAYDEALNREIAAEGFTLLKNNGALPLEKNERRVTVLGLLSKSLATGGGGSGSQSRPGNGNHFHSDYPAAHASTIFDALEEAGFTVNPRVRARYDATRVPTQSAGGMGGANPYENGHYMVEAADGIVEFNGKKYNPITDGTGTLSGADDNLGVYGDAAVIVISRTGSEGADNLSHDVAGHSDPTDHYSTLNDSEYELLAYAKANFSKVVVILNTPAVMEVGALEDDEGIDAVLWIGQPGYNGVLAVGDILTGKVNPSGHTVDFWMRDFETDPTWYNFGNYAGANYALNGEFGNAGNAPGMNKAADSIYSNNEFAVDYAEGIFMGYRYYETVAAELGDKGEEWYKANVVYPFGFGLSYSSFSQKILGVDGSVDDKDGTLTVKVEVTNTGAVSGKEVVQLYNTAPYTKGGIDKAAVALVGFGKTSVLNPGASEVVEITINVKDLASFDYNDRNGNGFCGYELEAGNYVLSVRKNSHEAYDSTTLRVRNAAQWDEDGNPDTPNNIFSQGLDSAWGQFNTLSNTWTQSHTEHYLHRDMLVTDGQVYDLKQLSWLLTDDNLFTEEAMGVLQTRTRFYSFEDHDNLKTAAVEQDYVNVWTKTKDDIPANWTQGTGVIDEKTGMYAITLGDMIGVPYDDPKWDEFLNQLTWDEMMANVRSGRYSTVGAASVGRYQVTDQDGPGQLRAAGDWAWACEVVMAATWNTELAYKYGEAVGNASIMGNINGWYGPAMNTHRNPLAGRNFEYFSQDGVQGGYIAAAVVKGATDKGVHVYIKHAFMNDQETSRMNGSTFVTEQAIREIYAKVFEICTKLGNANGFMSSFMRIGLETSASYAINQQLYRNEWGFEGYSVTDFYSANGPGWQGNQLVRGNTIPLGTYNNSAAGNGSGLDGQWDAEKKMVTVPAYDAELNDGAGGPSETVREDSPTLWFWTRDLTKNIMWTQANLNGQFGGFYDYMIEINPELSFKQNEAVERGTNILTAESRTQLEKVFGSTGYTVTATGLPKGVTVAADGTLSGTPAENGNKRITVNVAGNYGLANIHGSKNVDLVVADFDEILLDTVKLSNVKANLGTEFSAQVEGEPVALTEDNYVAGGRANADNVGKYVSKTYTASGLPGGLSINRNTGAITGTPTETGVFPVTVGITYGKVTQSQGRSGASYSTTNEAYTSTYRFTVDGGFNVVFDANNGTGATQNLGMTAPGALGEALESITEPTNGARPFLGWATRANATAADVDADTNVSRATTFYAVYGNEPIAISAAGTWVINGVDTGIPATGKDGADGKDGAQGPAGEKGEKGDKGDKGDKGATGAAGANGTNGKDGTAGANGKDGAAGQNGKDGSNANGTLGTVFGIIGTVLGAGALGYTVITKKKN